MSGVRRERVLDQRVALLERQFDELRRVHASVITDATVAKRVDAELEARRSVRRRRLADTATVVAAVGGFAGVCAALVSAFL